MKNSTLGQIIDALHRNYDKQTCLEIEQELNELLRFDPVRRKIIYDNSSIEEQIKMRFELLPEWEQEYINRKVSQ